jgi:hypothetical protein
MKTKTVMMLMVLVNMIMLTGFSQKRLRKKPLEITGAALLNDSRTTNYAISVYLDGTKIDSMYNKSKKSIKFYVNYNQVYTFLFQKQDCKDKIIIVNTMIPEGLKSLNDDVFDFEVEMSQSLAKKSDEIEDYPVAVLKISKDKELLEASESYYRFTHQNWEVTTLNVAETLPAKGHLKKK